MLYIHSLNHSYIGIKFLKIFDLSPNLVQLVLKLVACGCRIYWLDFYWGVRPHLTQNKCPAYDTKPSDGEALVLEFGGIWSTLSLPLLWPGVIVPFWVPSMDQIELFNYLQHLKPFNCVQTNNQY